MSEDPQRLAHQFAKSLEKWGGWYALTTDQPTFLKTPASDLVAQTYSLENPLLTSRYQKRKEEWSQIIHLSRVFLNACLIQELTRITDGSDSFDFLLDSLESPIEALMIMSLILCARETFIGASIIWTHPSPKFPHEKQLDFSLGNRRLILEIRPQSQIGEHRVDFLLSYYGTDFIQAPKKEGVASDDWQEIRIDKK